jgi:hypothetical protein
MQSKQTGWGTQPVCLLLININLDTPLSPVPNYPLSLGQGACPSVPCLNQQPFFDTLNIAIGKIGQGKDKEGVCHVPDEVMTDVFQSCCVNR